MTTIEQEIYARAYRNARECGASHAESSDFAAEQVQADRDDRQNRGDSYADDGWQSDAEGRL